MARSRKGHKQGKISDDVQSEDVFEVECIVDKRLVNNEVQYLLKWKGFPLEECTWEPIQNLACMDLVQEYEQKCNRLSKLCSIRDYLEGCEGSSSFREEKIDVNSFPEPEIATDEEKLVISKVIGVVKLPKDIAFLVRCNSTSNPKLIPNEMMKRKYSDVLIKYYESRIFFTEVDCL